MMNAVYCRNCRAAIEPADTFCKKCGADQRPPSQQPAPDPTVAVVIAQTPASPNALPVYKKRPSKVWVMAFFLLVFIAGGVAYVVFGKGIPKIGQSEVVTVNQLRADVLKYNGRQIRLRAYMVDYTLPDSPMQYIVVCDKPPMPPEVQEAIYQMDQTRDINNANPNDANIEQLNNQFYSSFMDKSNSIHIVPRPLSLQVGDLVEFDGVYDGEANVLHVTQANKVGVYRYQPAQMPTPGGTAPRAMPAP